MTSTGMPREDNPHPNTGGGPIFPLGASDAGSSGGDAVSWLGAWSWLDPLRVRHEQAIEILDRDLQYALADAVPARRSPDIRAVLSDRRDPILRDASAAVIRTAKARSFTAGDLRIRMFPLFAPEGRRSAVGLLLVADKLTHAVASSETQLEDMDRRLDATGQWLAPAIEATISVTGQTVEEARSAQRLAGITDIVDAFSRIDDVHQLIDLTVEAIALWYDADVRAYCQDFFGEFLLSSWLPGIDLSRTARRLSGASVWDRHDVFRLESARELEQLGWDVRAADTLFVPISIEDSVDWLITVSDVPDPSIEATLQFLRRILSLSLTAVERGASDRLQQKLLSMLTLGDSPLDMTVQIALETIGSAIGASAGRAAVYYDAGGTPALTVNWGATNDEPRYLEAGAMAASPHDIAVGVTAGTTAVAVCEFTKRVGTFSAPDARMVRSASSIVGTWLSGILVRRSEPADVAAAGSSDDLLTRLHGDLDRNGFIRYEGTLIAILPERSTDRSVASAERAVQILRDYVRASDIIGTVGDAAAGVMLPSIPHGFVAVVVERLTRAHVSVGVATFDAASESPEPLLQRALASAQRGTGR